MKLTARERPSRTKFSLGSCQHRLRFALDLLASSGKAALDVNCKVRAAGGVPVGAARACPRPIHNPNQNRNWTPCCLSLPSIFTTFLDFPPSLCGCPTAVLEFSPAHSFCFSSGSTVIFLIISLPASYFTNFPLWRLIPRQGPRGRALSVSVSRAPRCPHAPGPMPHSSTWSAFSSALPQTSSRHPVSRRQVSSQQRWARHPWEQAPALSFPAKTPGFSDLRSP